MEEVDILFKNSKVYNSFFKKFYEAHLAIKGDKIIYTGQARPKIIKAKKEIDLGGKYVVPGLIDIHMHIESSMAAPVQFADELIKHGLTTIVSEPHEIANTSGIEGIKAMIRAGEKAVVDIFYGIPSSVPSTSSKYETTGGIISTKEVSQLLAEEKVICLGEVMNNNGVLSGDKDLEINKILDYLDENEKDIIREGHIPSFTGEELALFVSRGIDSDHCLQSLKRLEDRIYNGVFVEIQEKSLKKEIIDYIKDNDLFSRTALVTDDVMADTLVEKGHLDHVLRKIVKLGVSIENAIYMATYTPAQRMRLYDRGVLAPNKKADFIVLSSLEDFVIDEVYNSGKKVYSAAENQKKNEYQRSFPKHFYNSIKLDKLEEEKLKIFCNGEKELVNCRLIEVKNDTTYTEERIVELTNKDGELDWENSSYNLAAVFSRYGNNNIARGLIGGSTIKRGAAASSYAHDHHNLYLAAANIRDGLIAANWVIENQGGYCVVENGEIIASAELPIAGILTEKSMPEFSQDIAQIREALIELGYDHYNPIMSFSTNTLPVSPALKITDKGLIDVNEMKIVDLIIE